ncbi:hypothetical protein O181_065904 [Austropuccinia psidii MF-1]|uniref:CCHC-type domain-containing protein n=1 Tax=Austropuccinia psidii MF-1 TaxID=1389203 RepID=A0A9Q3ESE1_9BASI|nr:hypothetical protein [Austropuccinia psidii MF-1]
MQSRWLLGSRHLWTHLADPSFVTTQALYPILVHSVPTNFDVNAETEIVNFCEENKIPRENLKKIKWIGNPTEQKKAHGSILMFLEDRDLAERISKGDLAYRMTHLRPIAFSPGPPQCFNCLNIGHISQSCKNEALCANCGKKHNARECKVEKSDLLCVHCINVDSEKDTLIDMMDAKYHHSCMSVQCQIKQAELAEANLAGCL